MAYAGKDERTEGHEEGVVLMAIEIEIVLIAGVVAIGLIVLVRAIGTGFAISRRPSHHLSQQTGAPPVGPAVDIRPPE
jgi:hypothetical protein